MDLSSKDVLERAYLLIYGLLDDHEAEELRSLLATDQEAAAAFETARSNAALWGDFVKTVPFGNSDDASDQNVSVDSAAESLAFDFVPSSFDDGVFIESTNVEISSMGAVSTANGDDKKVSRRNKGRKKGKIQEDRPPKTLLKQDEILTKNARRGAFIHGFGTLFKVIDGGVVRFFSVLWRSPVSAGLFTTLLILWGVATIAALRCDYLLTRRFFDDFRVQIAIPRVLARGVSQSIIVKTTGVDGSPRRAPARFCFSDPTTDEVLLSHTESGNSDGNLSYEAPDLTGFPDLTTLSIFVGANESESYKTTLKILNFEEKNSERASWNPPRASRSVSGKNLESPIFQEVLEFPTSSDSPPVSEEDSGNADVESPQSQSAESERVFLRFYPESGRFIAGFTNNVNVFCSDKDGRPLARRVSLFQENVEKPIASFATSEHGFASFQWNPVEGDAVAAVLSSGMENDSGGRFQNPFQQDFSLDPPLSHDDLNEFPLTIEVDPLTGKSFTIFYPTVAAESAYFSLDARTFASGERLRGRLSTSANIPLVITVEKCGVTVWQQFLKPSKNIESFDLQLPNSLVGFMKVALYSVAERRFLKLAETTVFRRPSYQSPVEYSAKITEESSAGEKRALVVDKTYLSNADVSNDKRVAKVDVYWAPKKRDALETIDADDVLMGMDEERRDETVKTSSGSPSFNPPIIFDNLEPLVKNARIKLDSFKENEAKSFLWIIRLVFVSCFSIALVAVFFTVFRAFSLGRSLVLCVLSTCLFFFALELQNMLDAFVQSSQDVVFAIDDIENQLVSQPTTSSKTNASSQSDVLPDLETSEIETGVRLIASDEFEKDRMELVLDDLLSPEELSKGVVFVKLDDGDSQIVKFISLDSDL